MEDRKKYCKVIILGAGGRDFFNFLRYYKELPFYKVVTFIVTQIPGIDNRIFPARLAGPNYPEGIPVYPLDRLEELIVSEKIKTDTEEVLVELGYSDISDEEIVSITAQIESFGAAFKIPVYYKQIMLNSSRPIIAITAVRTGCGKSAATIYSARYLKNKGFNPVIIRHPMPYFDLNNPDNDVQRFASYSDLNKYKCTFEEREEYEPIIDAGFVVYAGVDYEKILKTAECEGNVIIWDGGNNDLPFVKPDLWITITDSHRVGDELKYIHGYCNLVNADVVLINKTGSAESGDIKYLAENIDTNKKSSDVLVCKTDMEITVKSQEFLKDKHVIAVEDGPTVTHGCMSYGAAVLAAEKYGAILADPRPYLDEPLRKVFDKYPHLWDTKILPCMGYSAQEIEALEKTIRVTPADLVLYSSPIDLNRLIKSIIPMIRVKYELVFDDEFGEKLFKTEVLDKVNEIVQKHNID